MMRQSWSEVGMFDKEVRDYHNNGYAVISCYERKTHTEIINFAEEWIFNVINSNS